MLKKILNWQTTLTLLVGVILVLTFLNVLVTNPTVSGLSVVDASTQETQRFGGMTSLLVIIFAAFGLFLFIITRKMNDFRS